MKTKKPSKKERYQSKGLIAFFSCFYEVRPVESLRYAIVERESGHVVAHLVLADGSPKHEKATVDTLATASLGLQHVDH